MEFDEGWNSVNREVCFIQELTRVADEHVSEVEWSEEIELSFIFDGSFQIMMAFNYPLLFLPCDRTEVSKLTVIVF